MNKNKKEEQNTSNFLIPNEMKSKLFVGFNEGKLPVFSYDELSKKEIDSDFIVIKNVFSQSECLILRDFFNKSEKVNTNSDTVKTNYGSSQTGIKRASFYDKDWANTLFQRMRNHFAPIEKKDGKKYLLIGFNPLLRFIHYDKENHRLIPHYDVEIKISEQVITMKTIVIYLNNADSGNTNFLKDTRNELGHKDSFDSYPIIYAQKPIEGTALIFDHHVFHEGEKINQGDKKLILTTELCYLTPKP